MDLDSQPVPNYGLLPASQYTAEINGKRVANLYTSRGCPYDCGFCANHIYHKRKWRPLSVDGAVARLSHLKKQYGVNRVLFDDSEFFIDLDRSRELLKAIRKLDIAWSAHTRIDGLLRMSGADLELVEQSGCVSLSMGAESGSDRVLKLLNKGIKTRDTLEVNRKLAKYKFLTRFNIMIGMPGETREEMRQTLGLARRLGRENPDCILSGFMVYTPYPGTRLFNMAVKMGFKPPKDLAGWDHFWGRTGSLGMAGAGPAPRSRFSVFSKSFCEP
jgi:anaerobic magnesium-protoporphyrin IX monomethyl ester cyclase